MDKVIIIGLVILVIILIINLYEAYSTIQILWNRVHELSRELFELKNKEKIKKCIDTIKDSSISCKEWGKKNF